MKARIEKKLSKKLVQVAPSLFKEAWLCDSGEPTEIAYEQGSCVSGVYFLGGGLDYWGEGCDEYTVWEFWSDNFMWFGNRFKGYPEGHQFEGSPDIGNFKPTGKNLLNLARLIEADQKPQP